MKKENPKIARILTAEEKSLMEYVKFKFDQKTRITGFDFKQENSNAALAAMLETNKETWVREFIAASRK